MQGHLGMMNEVAEDHEEKGEVLQVANMDQGKFGEWWSLRGAVDTFRKM